MMNPRISCKKANALSLAVMLCWLSVAPLAWAQTSAAPTTTDPAGTGTTTPSASPTNPWAAPILPPDQVRQGEGNVAPAGAPPPETPYNAATQDPTPAQVDAYRSIEIAPVPAAQLLPIGQGKLPPIKLEASFNQPLTIEDALNVAMQNSLPIRIQKAAFDSQKWLLVNSASRFLPDYIMTYRAQETTPQGGNGTTTRTFSNTLRIPVFQGGRVTFSTLANYHRMKGQKFLYNATINDTLLNVYSLYYNLVLQQVLLQIRIKSVETSREQLRLNEQLRAAGTGTTFAVLQSRTQLALDKQALVQQQVNVRLASLNLAVALNTSVAINLMPEVRIVHETQLVDPNLGIGELTNIAMETRPELKQFQQLRLAANRQIQVAMANLYPTFQFFMTANKVSSGGDGGGGGNIGTLQAVGATGGILPAGAVAGGTSVIIPGGAAGGGGIGVSGGSGGESFSAGFDMNWSLTALGVADAANAMSLRAQARQVLLQLNQQALNVMQQVRQSYLNTLAAEEQVDVAAEGVVSGTEQLRLARLRLANGVGTNLELIQAQRDYITALVNQAQAIIAYNISQAQLLHDIGRISVPTLTQEVRRPIGWNGTLQ